VSVTLREGRRLRVWENWALRRIFGAEMLQECVEDYTVRRLMICISPHNIFWVIKKEKNEFGGGIWHVWGEKRCKQGFGGET